MSARGQKKKIILKTLRSHKTIWHPESTLVYKSRNKRVIIGRYVDGAIIPLDEKALDLCEQWGDKFPPDESLLEADSDNDDSKEEESPQDSSEGGGKEREEEKKGAPESPPPPPPPLPTPTLAKVASTTTFVELYVNQSEASIKEHEKHFSSFVDEILRVISSRDQEIASQKAALAKAETVLSEKTVEFGELEAKYKVIKKKFDTMKSLFA